MQQRLNTKGIKVIALSHNNKKNNNKKKRKSLIYPVMRFI